ncbi:MAG: hypothetical protein GY842_15605 [bacterium]|nr:hypothetical protein [bacterium]
MRRLLVIAMIAVLGAGSSALGQVGTDSRSRPARVRKTKKPKPNLQRFLRTRVPEVEWEEAPLGEIVEWVRDQGQVNVVVRWNMLLEHGVDEDTPVSLKLKSARMGTILEEVLAQLSESEDLRYLGKGLTLIISTRTDLNSKLYVRTYSVHDLLARVPDFSGAPQVTLEQASGGSGPGGGTASQNPFQGGGGGGGGDDLDNSDRGELAENLIEIIKVTVDPTSWRDNGGEGSIRAFNDTILVVRASLEVHEKIGGPVMLAD